MGRRAHTISTTLRKKRLLYWQVLLEFGKRILQKGMQIFMLASKLPFFRIEHIGCRLFVIVISICDISGSVKSLLDLSRLAKLSSPEWASSHSRIAIKLSSILKPFYLSKLPHSFHKVFASSYPAITNSNIMDCCLLREWRIITANSV